MLLGKDGGYFRLIGIATPEDEARIAAEFPKIAHSFALCLKSRCGRIARRTRRRP